MRNIQNVEFHTGSKEEKLPGFTTDFPYIASRAELDKFDGGVVPWHWHKAVELFYMESGILEYDLPKKKLIFPAGSGGFVNSNVLHMTKTVTRSEANIQLLHIFDASYLAGEQGSRIGQKYIMPVVSASRIDIVPLYPEDAVQQRILGLIQDAFYLQEQEFGYEIKLREALAAIWLLLFEQTRLLQGQEEGDDRGSDKIKQMMIYIHEHYAEKITIPELAAAAFLSERECFRIFRDCLHMTPVEYLQDYRLQMACQMLAKGQESVTVISHACGLGSSSYFGKVFRERMGCTPLVYRNRWQNSDT